MKGFFFVTLLLPPLIGASTKADGETALLVVEDSVDCTLTINSLSELLQARGLCVWITCVCTSDVSF